jgi:hypothetical protein
VHVLMAAHDKGEFQAKIHCADMVNPDGTLESESFSQCFRGENRLMSHKVQKPS